jgi:phosphoribosylanthranilate isomerase
MWVKICGIRDVETARATIAAGADAIGLNFVPGSVRELSIAAAQTIVSSLPAEFLTVGVIVNLSTEEIDKLLAAVPLVGLQLHGEEPPEQLRELRQRYPYCTLLKAWRLRDENVQELWNYLRDCQQLNALPDAVLVDSWSKEAHGGTGVLAPWSALTGWQSWPIAPRLVLAGGLTPANIAEAVTAVRPWGVDVASGVERAPGVKDLGLITDFLQQARINGS